MCADSQPNWVVIGSGVVMKHRIQNILYNLIVLRSAGLALILLVLLQGCAAVPERKAEAAQAANQAKPGMVISAEARADFDAAIAHIKAEEYENGIELLNRVAKAAPNNAISNINLALVYKKLGKLLLAEDSLKQAFMAEPENPVAHNEYALLYRKTGRFKEARDLYEKILEKYPNYNMVHRNLGILCDLYMRDYACALKHYVIYSDAMQDDRTVKIWIADIQKRTGK